jgi:hypothetical protein
MGAWWAVGSTTSNQVNIQAVKNSNSTIMIVQETIPTSVIGLSMGGTKMVYMNGTTDYLSFTAFTANAGGQTLQVGSTATGQGTWCSAHLIAYGVGNTVPVVQYGTTTGSSAGGNVTVTLPTAYTSSTSYVAFAVMQDSIEAKIAVNRNSASSITIYWSQGGSGTHTIAWHTMGT